MTQLRYLLDYLGQFEMPYFFVQGNHDHQFLNFNSMKTRITQSKYGYIELTIDKSGKTLLDQIYFNPLI